MRSLIHRSSALRASTDAYGTGILADAIMLSIYSRHRNPKDEDRPAAWHPGRGARFLDRMSRGAAPKTPVTNGSPKPPLGCRTDCLTGKCDTLAGSYTLYASSLPGVFGTSCLDTRSKKR